MPLGLFETWIRWGPRFRRGAPLRKWISGRKEELSVERRGDKRTILTTLGEVEYRRTYYRTKEKEYCYPVDAIAGSVTDMGEKSAQKYKELLPSALRDGDKERFAALSDPKLLQ